MNDVGASCLRDATRTALTPATRWEDIAGDAGRRRRRQRLWY